MGREEGEDLAHSIKAFEFHSSLECSLPEAGTHLPWQQILVCLSVSDFVCVSVCVYVSISHKASVTELPSATHCLSVEPI